MKQNRQTSTKQDIRDALTQLLLTESFESISVSRLARKAGINRGTFYLHYLDKYDLMDKLKEETLADLNQLFEAEPSPVLAIQALLDYIKSHYNFIYAISRTHFVDFSQAIKDFILHLVEEMPGYQEKLEELYQIPQAYAQEVLLASSESILATWIATGAKESTQEMTQMILKISHFEEIVDA